SNERAIASSSLRMNRFSCAALCVRPNFVFRWFLDPRICHYRSTMPEQSIKSEDMTLKRAFQDFYTVPDYQREYVWGEADGKGQRGDEVEQFLRDIQHLVPGGLSEREKVEG